MQTLHRYGYYRVAAATPAIRVADVAYNKAQIMSLINQAQQLGDISLLVFPELCLCGASCQDLFLQKSLQRACRDAIVEIAESTKDISFPIVLGSPIVVDGRLYNCAVVLIQGEIKAVIPKRLLSEDERNYFVSFHANDATLISFGEDRFSYFEPYVSFYNEAAPNFCFRVEMGLDHYDLPSVSELSRLGLTSIVVNPCALPARIGQYEKTAQAIQNLSDRNSLVYLHVNAGYGESTTHGTYGGESFLYEAGKLIAQATPFARENRLTVGLIDLEKIETLKIKQAGLLSQLSLDSDIKKRYSENPVCYYQPAPSGDENSVSPLVPQLPMFPFIPENPEQLERNCRDITEIVCQSLIKRLEHIHSHKVIIGISGGLDSTLALLFLAETFAKINAPLTDIIGVRMPGFGTSGTTYENSCKLMRLLGITEREVDIKASVIQHLKDISHPLDSHDTTYENAQARERTQILMDISNQVGGIVIGTGDLSELALGFCTYNGDHMSMYSLNGSIPKTLIPYVIRSLSRKYQNSELISVLESIIDTPISPELLPPNANQQILQKTEELVGPYALHDFFLYYMLRYGFSPSKIKALAEKAFAGVYTLEEITKWQQLFYRRFFSQQFKRNCLPDGPVFANVSLFHTFHMPSDAMASLWLRELN